MPPVYLRVTQLVTDTLGYRHALLQTHFAEGHSDQMLAQLSMGWFLGETPWDKTQCITSMLEVKTLLRVDGAVL